MATKVLITTVYPGLGPTQRKNLMKIGLRYHHDLLSARARSRNGGRALAKRIGCECATCLDQGYVWPGGTRKSSTWCGCAVGREHAGQSEKRRAIRRASARAYAVQVIGAGVYPAPQDRTFRTWQSAYAEVKRLLQDVPAGAMVDVVDRTHDAEVYRLVGRWEVDASEFWRVV
jgi:hypothetical protein